MSRQISARFPVLPLATICTFWLAVASSPLLAQNPPASAGRQPAGNQPAGATRQAGPTRQASGTQPARNANQGAPRVGQRPMAGPTVSRPIPRAPMQPSWIPLPAKHEQYLDQILAFWEHKSSQIQRFRCTFKRWEYDPVFGPRETFYRYSEGEVKFAAPDKGLFKATKVLTYQAPSKPGEKAEYVELPNVFGEHWVCNGQSVFELDHQRKRMVQTELPPDMRGEAIRNGPLPFLFGAKKDAVKQRFWVRVITPADVKGEYWLEAHPKTREDGANFKMVHIIIDEKDYLPKGIVLFDRSFVAGRHPARTTFSFENRETNWNALVQQLNPFLRQFYEPAVPRDWEKIVNKYRPTGTAQAPAPKKKR